MVLRSKMTNRFDGLISNCNKRRLGSIDFEVDEVESMIEALSIDVECHSVLGIDDRRPVV